MQIKVSQLSHIYDAHSKLAFKALDNVSVALNQSEFVTIIGHTGSGKTTFIEHLNLLARPSSGEVELEYEILKAPRRGAEVVKVHEKRLVSPGRRKLRFVNEVRSRIGVAFQFAEYQLFEDTVLKDIIFGPLNLKIPKKEAIELAKKYIKLVGLDESYLERSPFALSGGQKRRVALAGILAMNPDFLVLDEPTAGLDPQGTKDMYAIFKTIHAAGKTVIIVTHNLDLVLEHSHRTLMFKHGKLIRDELSLDLMYEPEFLTANELEPPKLTELVMRLEKTGKLKIGKVRTIEALGARIAHAHGAKPKAEAKVTKPSAKAVKPATKRSLVTKTPKLKKGGK